ncbi:MAG: tetratricopeptide repeat protein [Ignavibacteriales bacterium]|nr:tetratricopeptide repeat protein [Ignavibacteriales bacterium]
MSFARTKEIAFRLSLPALMISLLVWGGCSSEQAVKVPPGPTPEHKKIDSLETVNVTLKQKLVKFEQDNNSLNARLSDVEAKLKAELDRAAAAAKPPPPPPAPAATYEGAQKAFGEKKYDEAIQMFQALLDGGTPEDLADNCHYWIGESYFGKKDYKEAVKHLEMVFQYKTSEKKGDAYYMLGRAHEMLGDKAKAKESYEKVVKDFPTNDNVKKAKERWGRL